MDQILLDEIIPTEEQIVVLYDQLKSRSFGISHIDLPSFQVHKSFTEKNPYRKWFLVKLNDLYIGNVYLQYDNSIGLNLNEEISAEKIRNIIKIIYNRYKPLKSIPSVRIDKFYINVHSANSSLQEKLSKIGLLEIQRTFLISNIFDKNLKKSI
tara:strand:+ start:309 stop:770 length:462 start_codon:yes stop_codon:yes gene_type:complete